MHLALQSSLGFGTHIVDTVGNYTLLCLLGEPGFGGDREDAFQQFLSILFSFPSLPRARELVASCS